MRHYIKRRLAARDDENDELRRQLAEALAAVDKAGPGPAGSCRIMPDYDPDYAGSCRIMPSTSSEGVLTQEHEGLNPICKPVSNNSKCA